MHLEIYLRNLLQIFENSTASVEAPPSGPHTRPTP